MKIAFNESALKKIGNNKIILDKNGVVKDAVFDADFKEIIKKLRDQEHESYIFFLTDERVSNKEKAQIKNKILKKYKLEKKYEPRIVIIEKSDYENSLKRNGISINTDHIIEKFNNNVDEYTILNNYIQEQINKLKQPMLDENTKSTGLPSEDKFWLKYQTKEDYRYCNELYSPYERLKQMNSDFMDEIFIESSEFGTKMTYEEVFNKIDETANAFLANGIKEGTKVPLLLTTSPETFIIIFALLKAKATIVPLFPKSTESEIKAKLENINYDYIISHDIFYKTVNGAKKKDSKVIIVPAANSASFIKKMYFENVLKKKMGCEKIVYSENVINFDDFIKKSPKYTGEIDTSYDENYEAVQLFTGGTVRSKGVVLTSKNLEAAHHGFPTVDCPILRDDKFSCFLPINHVFGLVSIMYSATSYGAKLSIKLKIDLKKMDKLFSKDKITIFAGIPTMVDSILNSKNLTSDDLKQLRRFILGGAKTVDQVKRNIKQFGMNNNINLEVIDGLGQTEVSTAYLYNNILSVNDEVKITDPETGKELGYNQVGEICVSGPSVMKGYVTEEDNLQALEKDSNGKIWFHTGDVGYNDNGKIYHTGRLNRRIKVNGELICVEDLETVISQHEAIKDCCVVGKTDLRKESIPVAFITLKDGYTYDEFTKQSIEDYYSKNIVYYARPAITKCLNELPKTTIGKPDFKQLQLLADCMEVITSRQKIK